MWIVRTRLAPSKCSWPNSFVWFNKSPPEVGRTWVVDNYWLIIDQCRERQRWRERWRETDRGREEGYEEGSRGGIERGRDMDESKTDMNQKRNWYDIISVSTESNVVGKRGGTSETATDVGWYNRWVHPSNGSHAAVTSRYGTCHRHS